MTTRIHEVREISELESYREAWQRLHAITPGASFFQSIDWFRARLRHGTRDLGFRVLIVQRNGEVQGIVPLVIQRETTRLGPVRILTFPLDGWGSFYGPLGADPLEMLTLASDYLASATRDYDLIDLRDLIPPCDQVASHGETGARMTHDIKNLLQSLNVLCSAIERDAEDQPGELVALLRRQLPVVTQRLQQTLDKLQKPQTDSGRFEQAKSWWDRFQKTYRDRGVDFFTGEITAGVPLPKELFDSAGDNLIQNALRKRKLDEAVAIQVRFHCTDTVEDRKSTRLNSSH